MSSQTDRNPSPPPEVLEHDEDFVPDRIGNSMYSKRWLYKTLMKMLKVVEDYTGEKKEENKTTDEDTSKSKEVSDTSQNIVELDKKIEEDACTLWDMSANSEVADFLCESSVADIFLTIIEHTQSPRLLEIVVGIIGNMCSFKPTCEYISKNKPLVHSIITLSGCSDSCTLVQLFRLLNCGIAKGRCEKEWFGAFAEYSFFMENLKSIFENNLCHDVLKGLIDFLNCALDNNSSYNSIWTKDPYALAIIEAGKQLLKCNQYEDLDSFFLLVSNLCNQGQDSAAYAKRFEALRPIFHAYFIKLGEEETLPPISRVNSIGCVFAMYGNILLHPNIPKVHVKFENAVIRAILTIAALVNSMISNLEKAKRGYDSSSKGSTEVVDSITKTEERNGSASEETCDSDLECWGVLLETLMFASKAILSHPNEITHLEESDIQSLEEIVDMNESEYAGDSGT